MDAGTYGVCERCGAEIPTGRLEAVPTASSVHPVQGSRRDPLDLAHPGRVFAAIALAILVVDQIAKAVVRASHGRRGSRCRSSRGVLNLTYVRNVGAAFGLFPGRPAGLHRHVAASCSFVIAAYWRRAQAATSGRS